MIVEGLAALLFVGAACGFLDSLGKKIEKNPHNPHKRELPDPRPNYCPNVRLTY